ncbi:MAG TPA: hypothetical protein VFC15_19240 [Candidatus Limnocylindrales bacterium]|jgi:hypothetical protein|nr:hypothetical protein [Candidatus Limnocylindrales bacterium]
MPTRYRVVRVKDVEPETFIIVGIDFDEHTIKSTSKAMSEAALRAHLREAGASADETTTWIEQGRAYPE